MSENTLKQIDRFTRDLNADASSCIENFMDYVVGSNLAGNGIPVATDATTNIVATRKNTFYVTNIETQTLLSPVNSSTGLNIAGDATGGDGYEINLQNPGNTDAKFNFTVGSEPVGFYLEAQITTADISGAAELLVGFRKAGVHANARATYTDYTYIGMIQADIKLATDLADAGETLTDTTMNAVDGGQVTLRLEVTTDGKVTYLIKNGVAVTEFVKPTVNLDYTFADATIVVPSIRLIQHSDITGACIVNYVKIGYIN
jgi:hypothetical protein